MSQLKEIYKKEVASALMSQFHYKNVHEAPRMLKVIVSIGLNSQNKDPKIAETATETVRRITGQMPVKTRAKKSIAGFKVRQGMVVGLKTTLRGERMYDFVERLIRITLPRLRDFRGLSDKLVDRQGNVAIGFRDVISFPELQADAMERTHGLEVVIATSAKNREEGIALLKLLGFPFRGK